MGTRYDPKRSIIRKGKKFVYSSEVFSRERESWPLSKRIAKRNASFIRDQGRKVVIVERMNGTEKLFIVYVSSDFYPSLCTTMHPAYGTGSLLPSSKRRVR